MIRLCQGMSLPCDGILLINRRKFSLDIEAHIDTLLSCPHLHKPLSRSERWIGDFLASRKKSCV